MYRALSPGALGVRVPFIEAVNLAAEYGFEGIEIGMGPVQELGLEGVQRLLAANNLAASFSGMPVNFRQDDETFARDLAGLPAFAEAMSALGCTRIITWFMPWHETWTYDVYFEKMRDRTARLCEVLARYDLRYGLEFVGPETLRAGKPNHFIHNIDGLLSLIDAVGADNLGFLLDCFHWYTSGGTAADLDKLSDGLVVAVHVNDAAAGVSREAQIDNIRAMPGETGVIDIATFMRALDRMGYTGPVIVEPFSERIRAMTPQQAVAATAKSLERIWQLAGL
ncbi:MAG: sugar phosphate isomerase/epimerase family protein [Anaerolineae bacterium]